MNQTDYDIKRDSCIGYFDLIKDKYPNDKVLHTRVTKLVAFAFKLGLLSARDPEYKSKIIRELGGK